MRGAFRFPGGDARTTVLGATGTGKTTCGVWLLAHQRFDRRPWIVFDFKREVIFDEVGFPPIEHLSLDRMPGKRGLYLVNPKPGEEPLVDAFLWRVWQRENIGIFVDEAALMPPELSYKGFPAILQQGRSKRLPVIACSQRPVNVARGLFSEASFFCVYRMADRRDYSTVQGFVPSDLSAPMPPHHWRWYDVQRNRLLQMAPVPAPRRVAEQLADALPYTWRPISEFMRSPGRRKAS